MDEVDAYLALAAGVEVAEQVAAARPHYGDRDREVSIHASCDKKRLEELGFEFLDDPEEALRGKVREFHGPSETDVHVRVRLPEGWTIGPSEDSRLKYIYDARGVLAVSTQYNGQFWDPYGYTSVVNLGYWIPTHLIYGDEMTLEDVWWDKLTDEERQSVVVGLRTDAARKEKAYADSAKRAREWLKKLRYDEADRKSDYPKEA